MCDLTVRVVPLLAVIAAYPMLAVHVRVFRTREVNLRAEIASQILFVELDTVLTESDHTLVVQGHFLCLDGGP